MPSSSRESTALDITEPAPVEEKRNTDTFSWTAAHICEDEFLVLRGLKRDENRWVQCSAVSAPSHRLEVPVMYSGD